MIDVSDADAQMLAIGEFDKRVLDALPAGFLLIGTDGKILMANAEAERMLGLSERELAALSTYDVAHLTYFADGTPADERHYPVMQALTTGQRQSADTMGVRRPNGEISWILQTAVPVLQDGKVVAAIVTFVDVTAQRATALALRESEARLRAVMDGVPGYVVMVSRDLRITFCTRTLPGVTMEAVVNQDVRMLVAEPERPAFESKLRHVLETGEHQVCELAADIWLGGTYRLALGPVRYGDKVEAVTIVAEEISRQKEMEAQLMLSERMASIGTLAAGVAHEINNPLTYVLGNLELLERQLGHKEPALVERVQEAAEGAERIASVVRDLMTFSHREETSVGPISLAETIDKAVRLAHHELHRRARVLREDGRVPPVRGAASRVAQVVLNLLINAAHSIEPGNVESNEIRITTRQLSDDMVRISVSDTGRGIERALLGKIFDPFITTQPVGEGTGLGLYVCHNIVSSLGGAIWVDSQVGRGTTFHVDLPVFQQARTMSAVVPAIPQELNQRLTMLVIDDEPSIAAFIKHAFAHHDVSIARSGRDALAQLEIRGFDAVICDVVMPDMTGVAVLEHLRRHRPELARRFLFITGGALGELAPEVRSSRCPVLYKPFNLRELRGAVARLIQPSMQRVKSS